MADGRIQSGFRNFDESYDSLKREFDSLSDLDVTPRINKLVAILNPIGSNFDEIASSGRREDIERTNNYVTQLNERMKKCEDLSKSIYWVKAKANRKEVFTTNVTLAPIQKPVSKPLTSNIQEEVVTTTFVPNPIEVLTESCRIAINEFDRIYADYQNFTKQDVWSGKSNDIVKAWSRWCEVYHPAVADQVKNSRGNAPRELRDMLPKFNTFGQDLSAKVQRFNLTQQQVQAISGFQNDHDAIYNNFRSNLYKVSVPQLDDYVRQFDSLSDRISNLGISDHPSIIRASGIIKDSRRNLVDVINQLKINPNTKINFNDVDVPVNVGVPRNVQPTQATNSSNSGSSASYFPKFCAECGEANTGGVFCSECGSKY